MARLLALALLALALYTAALATALPALVVPCRAELLAVPEPASWRSWPVAPAGYDYVVAGKMVDRRPFFEEIHVTAPGVCADGMLSLNSWITWGDPNDSRKMWHRADQLSLRREPGPGGVLVVEGHEDPPTKTVFVAAFRRDDSRVASVPQRGWYLFIALGAGIAALLGALVLGVLALRRRRLFADPRRIREGTRDAAGQIRLADDGALVSPAPVGPPGPVLVLVRAVAPVSYRDAPAVHAARVWSGRPTCHGGSVRESRGARAETGAPVRGVSGRRDARGQRLAGLPGRVERLVTVIRPASARARHKDTPRS